ncbi:MAG: tetratricopeptide repeat protein [Bryobacterales bacterium]|nr:tetratricopeptide repeat protein [Bryobacterales bacterium]
MRLAVGILVILAVTAQAPPPSLTVEYPLDGSIFPPEITAPEFRWHGSASAASWQIEVAFSGGAPGIRAVASDRRWTPDPPLWEEIKKRSTEGAATFTVTSSSGARDQVRFSTSRHPAGAPIFYRQVPLMPSEVEPGVIKPLAPGAIPLISWKLRYLDEPRSRQVLEGLHSCTNCHSFSRDGKTLGMDLDGPENEKGTYAIATVSPRMTIRNEDVITWNSFSGKTPGSSTIGFLSQMSPDGRYAVSTVNEEVYVSNFKDYRFLQVFYPTRGILAWYDRSTQEIKPLPGADDPRYVHTDAVWSPDGKYLVFARAEAKDAYTPGKPMAEYPNDPNETPIQYDLYRIPFNKGRGGRAEPIRGASANGMSNSFPKISPDGRWIVYVQARNGQLLRPDGQLYIVPASGGEARRMRANTPLMNSWHSFSPNGRWLVFSSKSRSPYTQMFLTYIDEDGNDSPAVLVENATDPERAVNLPEFADIPKEGLVRIEVPAAEFYRLFDNALELASKGRHQEAAAEWKKALALEPDNAKAHTNLGISLSRLGASAEAVVEFRRAVQLRPNYPEAHNNLGVELFQMGRFAEAGPHFVKYLDYYPLSAEVHFNLAETLYGAGKTAEAIQVAERAASLAAEQKNQALVGLLKERLAVYANTANAAPRPSPARR